MANTTRHLNATIATAIAVIVGCSSAISGCQRQTRAPAIQNPNILCRYEKGSINIAGIATISFPIGADQAFRWREADSIILAEHEHNEGEIEELQATRNNETIQFEQGYPGKRYAINLANGELVKTSQIKNKTFRGWSVIIHGRCQSMRG